MIILNLIKSEERKDTKQTEIRYYNKQKKHTNAQKKRDLSMLEKGESIITIYAECAIKITRLLS